MAAAKSGRDLVAYFAGHLANLVNGNDHLGDGEPHAEVRAFRLYEKVQRLLTGNRQYAEGLVGVWAYPAPADVEQAAEHYFDIVLDRPIGRRGDKPSSADNLRAAVAARAAGPVAAPEPGDALSTWKALTGGPARIRRFTERQQLYGLSNLILKCLDASNRPYAEVLRLGLCPRDWLVGDETVPVNTLKATNAFLKQLKAAMGGEYGRRPTPEQLAFAFAAAPIPGCADAAAFAATPFGGAVLSRLAGQDHTFFVSFDDIEATLADSVPDEDDAPLMDAEEALPLLEQAVRAGVVEADEKALLAAILDGRPLAEAMRSDLGLRRRLKQRFDNDLEAYVADLSGRVAAFMRSAAG